MRGKHGLRAGFSFFELMAVVVIISVASAVAIPFIVSWLPDYRHRSTARDIASTCQMARLKAVSRNLEYQVQFNTAATPDTYEMLEGDQASGSSTWTSVSGVPTPLPEKVDSISLTPAGTTNVIFRPNGTTTAGATVTVTVTNSKGNRFMVSVSNTTGRIRVDKI